MNLPADSQLTLVDPSTAVADSNTVLVLDVDDVKNTLIRLRGDPRPHYIVQTVFNTTTIHVGDLPLASVERRAFRPDQITFHGAPPTSLGDWLKAPMLSSFPLLFEERGKRFEWRENFVGQLSLHDPHDSETAAWFSKSRKRVGQGNRVVHDAFITIKPEYDYMRDIIVVSCLLAEHKLRMRRKNNATAEVSAAMGLAGFGVL